MSQGCPSAPSLYVYRSPCLTSRTVAGGKVELRGDVESASSASETWRVRMQKTYRHEMAKRRLAEKRQLGNGGATIAPDGITIVRDFGAAESSSMCARALQWT